MTELPPPEEYPIFRRIFEQTVKPPEKFQRNEPIPPSRRLTLVFDTETKTNVHQELRFGIAQVYSNGRLLETFLFTGEVTPKEETAISEWAKEHRATVLPVQTFVSREFLPRVLGMKAVVVGFNLPFDLSRIAADWRPKKKGRGKPWWTLLMVPESNPKFAYVPRLRVQRVNSFFSFFEFRGAKGRHLDYTGAFVDCKTFVRALTGESHSLKTAGEAFGCIRKKSEQDYRAKVDRKYLDYCLNDVQLTAELYERCKERYAAFELDMHPSRIFSSASLAKAIWAARGIIPPSLPPRITGQLMASFYAGKVECRVRAHDVEDIAVLDFTAQYPSLYCLLGAERFLTAKRITYRRSTEQVVRWVDGMTSEDLYRRETWLVPLMWTLCEVVADGEVLPVRSTYKGLEGSAPTIGWNHVTTEPGLTLPYMVADVLAAKLLGGRVPKIVRATTFGHVGEQEVKPVRTLGVEVAPSDGLMQTLIEARIREKRDPSPEAKHRADGLKTICNAGSYGIFVELNRTDEKGAVLVHGLDEDPFPSEETDIEKPGKEYCPLIAAALTSASHLTLALVDTHVERLGGRVLYCDTDSAFVTPSRIAGDVSVAFAGLNPYRETVDFLKDETEDKAPEKERPKDSIDVHPRFYGLSAKRYCLFVRRKNGRPYVFHKGKSMGASDHGLGSFQTGEDRKAWVAGLWERIIEKGEAASEDYAGIPATSEFTLSTPNLLPRVRNLGPIRPFTFLTARLLEPSSDPNELRSDLVAYVNPKDSAGQAELMALPRQRSWGSVVEDFVRHMDRKYDFDSEGRAVRRHVLVLKRNIIPMGKEANRIEDAKILGLKAVGGKAKTYVDWKARLLSMGRPEARRLGLPYRAVKRWKARVRTGKELRGDALARLRRAFVR
ncbi:MAG: hypothetical protein ACREDK_06970 [Thermoplasmata archaeon]